MFPEANMARGMALFSSIRLYLATHGLPLSCECLSLLHISFVHACIGFLPPYLITVHLCFLDRPFLSSPL